MTDEDNISKAKAHLIVNHPFYASLLLGLDMHRDDSVKTMATNGEVIRYNQEFVNNLDFQETVFVLTHEVLHCVFHHMYRRDSRDPGRWNQAADYVINEMLVNERIGKMPKGGLLDPALVARGGGSTEGVYDLLPEPPKGGQSPEPGDMDGGGSMDNVEDAAADQAELEKKEAKTKVRIIQAANAAKMAGNLPADLERLVNKLCKPTVNWKAALRNFLTQKAKNETSFARPKRRFLADDLYLPGLTGEKLGEIAVAIDCSGSISDEMIAEFAAEVKGIFEDTTPSKLHVIYFDHGIKNMDTFGPDDEVVIKGKGGGGTDFAPIWKHIEENELDVVACVVLTDLYGPHGDAPDFPVLWASNGDSTAPFGDVIMMR